MKMNAGTHRVIEENINYWEKVLQNPPQSFINLFEQEKAYLRKHVKDAVNVLDVGCGNGRNILSVVDIAGSIVGVDVDPQAVESTRKNTELYRNVNAITGSATNLPFEDNMFDIVIFSMTLVNLGSEKSTALSEMKRVAKSGAKIIISVYSENALEERMSMYRQVQMPIVSETNGKVVFAVEGFVSEQFSLTEIKKMIEPYNLEIDTYEEVENLAYILTLRK
jgi:ubiquinone/menaquinone biosynthesis C-methylase UbiE